MFRADKKLDVREEDGVKKVDVDVKVDEGEQYTVRHIAFEGNTKTKDKVLRRSMILKEGDVFRTEQFKDSFTGISQLGYFDVKTQEPKVDLVPDKPQVDITIKGEEAGVNELMFQGGYGSVFGFSLGASFSTKNLGGGGRDPLAELHHRPVPAQRLHQLHRALPAGHALLPDHQRRQRLDGLQRLPGGRRLRLQAVHPQHRRLHGHPAVHLPAGPAPGPSSPPTRWATRFRIIRIEGGQNYYYRNTSRQLTSTINQTPHLQHRQPSRSSPPPARRSAWASNTAAGSSARTRPFYRTTLEYEQVASIADRHIFAFNTSYGYMKNLSNSELPIWDLYRPGGENSIRGYRFGQVGSVQPGQQPAGGGRGRQQAVHRQLGIPVQDCGCNSGPCSSTIWARPGPRASHLLRRGLRRSAGVELRFFLPISPAPLRLIWARKLNPYPFDTTGTDRFPVQHRHHLLNQQPCGPCRP